jgi:hypothetical protein
MPKKSVDAVLEEAPAQDPSPAVPQPDPFDPSADVDVVIGYVRQLAADAARASAALVQHERGRCSVDHGTSGAGGGFSSHKDRAPDDPALIATLRKLTLACGEFRHAVLA